MFYLGREKYLLRKSDKVVLITNDFRPIVSRAGVSDDKIFVVHNWAPLDDMPVQSKSNSWSEKHGIADKFCFVYAGTLGMKHNPELLVGLSKAFADNLSVSIVVISEGLGAEYLREKKASLPLSNLTILPFQPFENLPMVLGSADVLIAVLEADAGFFSVPSKVLTSLCAQRPLLLSIPLKNLAAMIVKEQNAGIVISPDRPNDFISAANKLFHDAVLRSTLAINGRRYAENKFDIHKITDRFEEIISC
jgi:glycosyltransferase involved in cell wall biosynthesis